MNTFKRAWGRLVSFGFRLLYNEMAFTYDAVSYLVSMGAWRCWQRSVIPHLPSATTGRLLELAHGTGNLHLDLKSLGYTVTGYDLSPYMGRIAMRKLRKRSLSAALVRGRAQNLPFTANSFAGIVCTFPTPFIFETDTLAEIDRVLVPGGGAVVVFSGDFISGGVLRRFLEWLYRVTGQRNGDGDGNYETLLLHLSRHGFQAEIVYEDCPRSRAVVLLLRKINSVALT